VLPFADLSPEKNQDYFSEGLADDLLNDLAPTPGLRVAARSSSFQFRDHGADLTATPPTPMERSTSSSTTTRTEPHIKLPKYMRSVT
jgi:TolB-like protein